MAKTLHVLLIEDDADDVELLQDAFLHNKVDYVMDVINDGGEVSGHMRRMQKFPDIIVMDLNLPKVHGNEILRDLKASPVYKDIPVVVLTTSSSAEDKEYALRLGANDFLIKPTSSEGLYALVSVIAKIASDSPAK